ncbi:MAG: SusE domain-containing protein [Prevotellaceae bacterium]|jgi:hypothetical protein|nr:SusE domain-containing protein [Prevotellaceae bacterium]
MKTTVNKWIIALLLVIPAFAGCRDDMEYANDGVTPTTLIAPDDNAAVELFNITSAKVDFEWKSTVGGVYYQLAFYDASGKELYRVAPEERTTTTAVSHQMLNEIAHLAGIAPRTAGTIQWGVVTVKGMLETVSEKRTLSISSYTAFNDFPVSLYITGAGSEGSTDVSAAPAFRVTGEGTYEIYTLLKAGEGFYFTNKNTPGGGRTFTVRDDFVVEGSDALTVAAEGVYFITLNFTTAKMTVTAINNVRYFVPSANVYTPMTYKGYGKWEHAVTLGALTGSNNQYKFVANVGGTDRSWGCNTQAGQANPPQILEGDYFFVYQNNHSTSSSQRARYSFRYMTELSNQPITLTLDMSPDNDHYTHVVDAGDLTVYPVNSFIAPADGASVALSKVPNAASTFQWTPSSGTGPTPKYTVIFYSDAAGTNEIGALAADNNSFAATATVLHTALESIAAAAGIAAEGSGDIWWSVQTTVLTTSGIASIPPRKLTVTRFPGIPAVAYITGAASEAGTTLANAIPLKKTADGEFEIYTRLTTGNTYYFVNARTGTPRQFSVTAANAIVEGGTTTPAETAVYKIVLNFNTDVAVFTKITSVTWYILWWDRETALDYDGNGVWKKTVTFGANECTNGNGDNRYKFRMQDNSTTNSGRSQWIWANPPGQTHDNEPTGDPSYYYIRQQYVTQQWTDGYVWKIAGHSGWNSNTYDVTVSLKADETYTHMITRR